MNARMNRRDFLRLSTTLAAGGVAAACAPATPMIVEKEVVKEVPVEKIVEKEVVKEVPVEKIVKETVVVEKEVPAKPAGPVTVPFWGWWKPRMDLYDKAASRFEEKHPEVNIEVQTLPYGTLWEKVLPASVAGTGPTILKTKPVYHFRYLIHGLLEPYPEEVFPDSWWEDNFGDSWEAYRVEGKNYVYVVGASPNLVMYNRAMFEEAGLDPQTPPETWDELIDMGKQLVQYDGAGNITVAGFMTHAYFWPSCAYQLGGNIVKVLPDGTRESNMLSPESVEAFKFYTSLYTEHKIIPAEFLDFADAVGTKKCAIGHLESYILGEFVNTFPDTEKELGWSHSPTPTGKPDPSYGMKVNYIGLTVFKNRPVVEKEAAFEYLESLLNENDDILAEIAQMLGSMVGKVPVRQNPIFQEVEALRVVAEVLPYMRDPVALLSDETGRILNDARDRVVLVGMSEDESLQQAHEEWDAVLKEGGFEFLI